ncbi:uncharacterized protein [Epargyreus clarus]|uniref:uncharacterized protein n=1 Tax=Epargyreus clarus TaxID=520877 RepID=UPI003C2F732B
MEDISMDINFDKIFKIMIFGMRLNRSHPDIPRDRKWLFQFMWMHGIFFFVFCLLMYSTFAHDLKKNDFSQACSNGILSVIFSVVTYKYGVMLKYQNQLKGLMDEMRVDYERAKTLSIEEQHLVLNYGKRGKKVVVIWILIASITGGLFPVKAFILMAYYAIKGEFKLFHLYDLTYPSPVEERKNEPGVYLVLFTLFSFYDCYAIVMYIAMAALGPIFMLHGCAQLELVRRRIMNAFTKNDSEKSTLKSLNEIVQQLQKIYRFLERVQESFKILYELTLKATTVILPICFYQVIESFNKGEIKLEFISVIIGGIALSSIPCYYSDELMDMGENLRLAIYFCGWEGYLERHKTLRNTLLLLQSRAARPIAVRTMFRAVSLDALTDVYHQSYAIFNVLNAAWN